MHANCELLGIERVVFELVYESLIDIILKKPVSKDGILGKLDPAIIKIKPTSYPEEIEEGKENFKAVVWIWIPMEEIKDTNEEEEDEKDEESPKQKQIVQNSMSNRSRTINESKLNKTEDDDGEKHPEFSKDTIKA